MYRLFLATRYLWSRPISWISMVGIWLTVMALIATLSVMTGLLAETEGMIRGTTTDVILRPADPAAPPEFATVQAALKDLPGVTGATPRILRPALLRIEHASNDVLLGDRNLSRRSYVRVLGVDPAQERGVSGFDAALARPAEHGRADPARPFHVDAERLPVEMRNQELPGVLLGSRLFDWFHLRRHSVITLVTLPRDWRAGERIRPLATRCVVTGAIQTAHPQHDDGAAYMHLDDARDFVEWGRDSYTEIGVGLAPGYELGEVAARVRQRLAERDVALAVSTWRDDNAEFLGAVENERVMLGVLLFFFVAVACFNVFATITVMVTDKTRDIGVLNAMGATPRGVLGIFLLCGVIMTLFSAGLGSATGVLVARHINGLDDLNFAVTGHRIFPDHMYAFSRIPVVIEPRFVLTVFACTLALAFLCALLPALRAARLDPVAALRHE